MSACLSTLVRLVQRTVRLVKCKKTFLFTNRLTYKVVCVCKFSHRRTCLYVTRHLIFHVLSRLPRFHTNVSSTRRVHAHVRTLQDKCLHTFWLTKSCLCVTFNIWHHPFHLTNHIGSRNDVPPLDFNLRTFLCIQLLTHETMSDNIGFTDSNDSVHCKKTCPYSTFWLTWSCACANFDTRTHVCVQFRTWFPIASSNATCLYKLHQLWDVTMCNFSLKGAFLHYFDLRGRIQVQIFT